MNAPHKEIIWFEDSGHFPNWDEPDIYQDKIMDIVPKNTMKTNK